METDEGEQNLLIAEISLNVDTGRAAGVGILSEDGAQAVHKMATRYLRALDTMIDDGEQIVHIAFDPNLKQSNLSGGRYVLVAGTNQRLAEAVSATLSREIDPNHLIVVLGPDFCLNWKMIGDEVLRGTVASDMTVIFDVHYPIECSGPIADMMPHLTMIAGEIILQGAFEGDRQIEMIEGPTTKQVSAMEHRAIKAVGRAWHNLAHVKFGAFNQYMAVTEAYPAWTELSAMVADEASQIAESVDEPMPSPALAYSVHEAVVRVMDKIGIEVQACELRERFTRKQLQ